MSIEKSNVCIDTHPYVATLITRMKGSLITRSSIDRSEPYCVDVRQQNPRLPPFQLAMFQFLTILIVATLSNAYQIEKYDLFMPDVVPKKMDAYLCTPVRVNYTRNFYIVGFQPKANKDTAHHLLLYGCRVPGSSSSVWNCGEMANTDGEDTKNPCEEGSQVIYAWGLDAPDLILPQDVGFKVGGDTSIQYLVLQVHYLHIHKFQNGATDSSGVTLHYTHRKLPKTAGVLLLGTGGMLKPLSDVHMEAACVIQEDKVIHPFSFRAHTHKLGKVVSGWKIVNNSGEFDWKLIGKRDPLEPQMFYPVEDPSSVIISKGDIVAVRCTMYNSLNETVFVGGTSKDEMCNFYIMYWTPDDEPLEQKYCFSGGPPKYYWETGVPVLNNIPDKEASTV